MDYGVANVRGKVPKAEVSEIVRMAQSSGMNTLDTAASYGDSELRLGEVGVVDWRIVSKIPPLPNGAEADTWVRRTVERSLLNLRVSALDGLLLHRHSDLGGKYGERLYRTMLSIKKEGLVKKIGVSVYGPGDLDSSCGRFALDLVQAPLNLIDRRLVTSGWLSRLKREGIEVHVRSPFLQGLLLMRSEDRPRKFRPWSGLWKRWDDWQRQHSALSSVSACLAYPLAFEEVDRVVIGVDSVTQLEHITAAERTLTHDSIPDISCDDEQLVNPANWNLLED